MLDTDIVVSASTLKLDLEAVPAEGVVSGSPRAGFAELSSFGGLEIGVWEMTVGAARDTETDEVFVVLGGAASVHFIEEDTTIALAAGDVVRLRDGQRTVWTVTETLRKVYLSYP